jgi:hypothetical protein
MQRRAFLKRGLLGGAVLAAGGVGVALYPSRIRYTARETLALLDANSFNVMASIAARVVTAQGADHVAITHTIDHALARAAPEAQHDIVQLLGLFENGLVGLLLDGRLKPFTQLEGDAQDAALLAWRDSRLVLRRGAYKALKNLCETSFYRKESAWRLVGYPGPPDALLLLSAAGGVNPEPEPEPAP